MDLQLQLSFVLFVNITDSNLSPWSQCHHLAEVSSAASTETICIGSRAVTQSMCRGTCDCVMLYCFWQHRASIALCHGATVHWQVRHTIYYVLRRNCRAQTTPNVNTLLKEPQTFYLLKVFKSKPGRCLCTISCCHSQTKNQCGQVFSLIREKWNRMLACRKPFPPRGSQTSLTCKVSLLLTDSFSGGPCWHGGGSLSSQFTTLTACVTDSEPQICRESCLGNCQLSLSLVAIKDEGSFFSISPMAPLKTSPLWKAEGRPPRLPPTSL